MVQRKVQTKLAIQEAPNVMLEKRVVNLKQPYHFQDGNYRGGADLMKMMKKLSSIESAISTSSSSSSSSLPLRKSTNNAQSIETAVPLKQALTHTSDGCSAPNYMKPTSCSDARKEQSQVSVRNKSNSKLSSSIGSITIPTRTSSLKLVRSLIKSPRFKPARASRVALYEDVNIQKATCSSTLKDSKFPNYLTISPGGTEAEGTSVMKVCPYTYCSLNGHHHPPVTPLKCFLSARRRSLRNHKMVKLQALSPRPKPSNKGMKENGFNHTCLNGNEKSAKQEVGIDYFVEIFAKIKDGDAQTLVKNVPEVETTNSFPAEEHKEDGADEVHQPCLDQEEAARRSCSNKSELDGLSSIDVDYANSEATEMEWEEAQFSLAVLDDESDSNGGFTSNQDGDMYQEPVIKFDAIGSNCDEIIYDHYQVHQELFKEKTPSVDIQLKNDGTKQNFDTEDSETMCCDQFFYTEDSLEENNDLSETEIEISSSSVEDLVATGEEIRAKLGVFEVEDHTIKSHLRDVEGHWTASWETYEGADTQPRNEDDGSTSSISNQNYNAAQDISTGHGLETAAEKVNPEIYKNDVISVSGSQMEKAQGVDNSKLSSDIANLDSAKTMVVHDEDANTVSDDADTAENCNSSQYIIEEEATFVKSEDNLANGKCTDNSKADTDSFTDEDQCKFKNRKSSSSTEGKEHSDLKLKQIGLVEKSVEDIDRIEVAEISEPDAAETFFMTTSSTRMKRKFSHLQKNLDEELLRTNRKWKINCRRTIKEEEEQWKYTQRGPNYLPLVPGPDAEKVDLRHQTLDEKKNSEEWMLDFAIQQAVTKLAPARKKKVALLVEAFERVMPAPKHEPRSKRSSAAFSLARPMQTCS